MTTKQKLGHVEYQDVGEKYFQKRGLRRYARAWSLWALGVGAVISGDFFGWNFGLAAGGFGGMLIATVVITGMYVGLCYSIAEMSPALPHTGGAYSFGRSAMGPWGGFVTGLGETMEYVITPAVIVVGIGGYLGAVFETPESFAPGWWLIMYLLFVGLNVVGVEASFRFTVFITFLALAILTVFYVGAIPHFSLDWALNIEPEAGGSRWLPRGWMGVAAALPFAIWFYLAIEELPLAAEEAHDPQRDMPRGLLYGLLTLAVTGFLVLFLNAGIAPGAVAVGASDEPLFLGFQTIFGDGVGAKLLALIASFHTIIFAYGRNIYSLSRAGYFPKWLSLTHGTRKTPHVALVAGAVLGYLVALGNIPAAAKQPGRRRPAQHGRVRRADFLHHAAAVVRAAAPQSAADRAALCQPAWRAGRHRGAYHLRGGATVPVSQPRLQQRRARRGSLVFSGFAVFCAPCPQTPGVGAGGGVCREGRWPVVRGPLAARSRCPPLAASGRFAAMATWRPAG